MAVQCNDPNILNLLLSTVVTAHYATPVRNAMNRCSVFSLSAIAAFGLATLSTSAIGQQNTIKEQIVGTWTFVSSTNVMPDGTKIDQWAGSNPKGIFMLAGNGHFAFFITRSDLPKFAGKTMPEGTAAEYKAVMTGLVGSFGTYKVNEADKILITHVEGSSFPNLSGSIRSCHRPGGHPVNDSRFAAAGYETGHPAQGRGDCGRTRRPALP